MKKILGYVALVGIGMMAMSGSASAGKLLKNKIAYDTIEGEVAGFVRLIDDTSNLNSNINNQTALISISASLARFLGDSFQVGTRVGSTIEDKTNFDNETQLYVDTFAKYHFNSNHPTTLPYIGIRAGITNSTLDRMTPLTEVSVTGETIYTGLLVGFKFFQSDTVSWNIELYYDKHVGTTNTTQTPHGNTVPISSVTNDVEYTNMGLFMGLSLYEF